jgi:hypothetical protein
MGYQAMRAAARENARRRRAGDDEGLTMVELMVAFTCLIVLLTLVATALTTYLTAGTTVISSYNATDQLLPSSMIIQRLIRSEVEPAPSTVANSCSAVNTPCPPFVPSAVGTYSMTFYANVGLSNGPAKIVMAEGTASKCSGCKFSSAVFTVTEYPACPTLTTATSTCPVNTGCPFSTSSTSTCAWSTSGTVLVDIPDVVNGDTPVPNSTSPAITTSTPIFTYNTLDPYSGTYVSSAGGTPGTGGILPNFASCSAPTPTANPTTANCLADTIQSVGVDLEVEVQGATVHENAFTVYRLSSSSYLYSPLVG